MLQCVSWILGASFSQETRALDIAVVVVRALSHTESHRHLEAAAVCRAHVLSIRFTAPQWHAAADVISGAVCSSSISRETFSGLLLTIRGLAPRSRGLPLPLSSRPCVCGRLSTILARPSSVLDRWGLGKAGFRSRSSAQRVATNGTFCGRVARTHTIVPQLTVPPCRMPTAR